VIQQIEKTSPQYTTGDTLIHKKPLQPVFTESTVGR
jgi:hypothetical protein